LRFQTSLFGIDHLPIHHAVFFGNASVLYDILIFSLCFLVLKKINDKTEEKPPAILQNTRAVYYFFLIVR
jgi:hypothetical protein